jgi:hypothetical protein
MAKKSKVETTVTEPVKKAKNVERSGHVFYSVFSKSRGGFITEHSNPEKACETVDSYWFEHKRNLATGKWSNRVFDVHIVKRDTRISHYHSEAYLYSPGALSEQRREAKLRERYGDDYREDEDIDNFDSSKYM